MSAAIERLGVRGRAVRARAQLVRCALGLCVATSCSAPMGTSPGQSMKQENSEPQGVVIGRVLDVASGQALSGVQISTYSSEKLASTITDLSGRYQLGPIAAGNYTLFAQLTGYVSRAF